MDEKSLWSLTKETVSVLIHAIFGLLAVVVVLPLVRIWSLLDRDASRDTILWFSLWFQETGRRCVSVAEQWRAWAELDQPEKK